MDEHLRMRMVSGREHRVARSQDLSRATVVDGLGRQHADATVTMFGVVPVEEGGAESPGVLDTSERAGESRAVLERSELTLGVRIVVRNMGATVRLRGSKVRQ